MTTTQKKPKLLIFSSLFPSSVRPNAGLFVRERTFRLQKYFDLTVVSPVPWFPLQHLIQLFKPDYRQLPKSLEVQHGINVHYPRFLSFPFFFRRLDSKAMYRAALKTIKKEHENQPFSLIDSHFTYPDGAAAVALAQVLKIPCTITLRGTEVPHAKDPRRKSQLLAAWSQASAMICVSDSLKQHAISLGADPTKFTVVGNGIDTAKFTPIEQQIARQQLQLPADAKILITIGGLVKRKGFHHVINAIPALVSQGIDVHYLIVGGANSEGDFAPELNALVQTLGLQQRVHFLGAIAPDKLKVPLSAADAFVLASSNEGWANVILEAMACGLPVVATDVGGNREVVSSAELGFVVPLNDKPALENALADALQQHWSKARLTEYAAQNHWDRRIEQLRELYRKLGIESREPSSFKTSDCA
jgi:teichuronic acid biosynthesis glycosyltransferase TuaC